MECKIKSIKYLTTKEGNFVRRISWQIGDVSGEAEAGHDNSVPLESITTEQLIEWIESYIGEDAVLDIESYVSPILDPKSEGTLIEVLWG